MPKSSAFRFVKKESDCSVKVAKLADLSEQICLFFKKMAPFLEPKILLVMTTATLPLLRHNLANVVSDVSRGMSLYLQEMFPTQNFVVGIVLSIKAVKLCNQSVV